MPTYIILQLVSCIKSSSSLSEAAFTHISPAHLNGVSSCFIISRRRILVRFGLAQKLSSPKQILRWWTVRNSAITCSVDFKRYFLPKTQVTLQKEQSCGHPRE